MVPWVQSEIMIHLHPVLHDVHFRLMDIEVVKRLPIQLEQLQLLLVLLLELIAQDKLLH